MATIMDILTVKGGHVLSIGPEATVLETALLMNEHKVGSLVVMTGGQLIGIITERDILRACAATRGPLEFLNVRERMTRCPIVASPGDEVADIMCLMTERRIRHVPVVEHGRLAGLISIGDTVKAQHDELCRENHYLKSYIQS